MCQAFQPSFNALYKEGVIPLAEFCECGSLVIDSRCSNKHCTLRAVTKPAPVRKSSAKAKATGKGLEATKPSVKVPNPRRASKCVTYNLYETQNNEPES
jgi:hypothetical protein